MNASYTVLKINCHQQVSYVFESMLYFMTSTPPAAIMPKTVPAASFDITDHNTTITSTTKISTKDSKKSLMAPKVTSTSTATSVIPPEKFLIISTTAMFQEAYIIQPGLYMYGGVGP